MIIQNRIRHKIVDMKINQGLVFEIFTCTIPKGKRVPVRVFVGYLDYGKAFDSVEHSDFFTALRNLGAICVQYMEDIHKWN